MDINPLSVGKHLVDTKHLASMLADLTYLTYLPDLTIYEKLNNLQSKKLSFHSLFLDHFLFENLQI